jgi:hypothetical protein
MAKGQHLSAHQQKIVKRYYNNLDAISLAKLSELVSDLAVCPPTDEKKAVKLWERVGLALAKTDADPVAVKKIIDGKSVKGLAELVGKLAK